MTRSDERPLRGRRVLSAAITALVALFSIVASVAASHDPNAVHLHAPHRGAGSATFQQGSAGDCAGATAGVVTWHFVANQLPPGTTSGSLTADFVTTANQNDAGEFMGQGSGAMHFFVETPSDDVLIDAWVTFNVAPTSDTNLVLSHVCRGINGGTTTGGTTTGGTTTGGTTGGTTTGGATTGGTTTGGTTTGGTTTGGTTTGGTTTGGQAPTTTTGGTTGGATTGGTTGAGTTTGATTGAVLGGNPTPRTGTLPDTAGELPAYTSPIAVVLAVVLISSVATLAVVQLRRAREE